MLLMANVVIEGLTKEYRGAAGEIIPALQDLTLSVNPGELLVIVGPSGSGKTTTLRLLAGLESPTKGVIRIDGRDMRSVAARDRDIAMVFQNQALYPHMSVRENLAFGLELRKVPRAEIEQRVVAAANTLDLGGCLDRKPEALSGGQRQRVALGRALVRKPGLFLFDEPLSNLDPPLRLQMRGQIARLHARLGAAMIYVTHDQAEAMALADRIAVLNRGSLQQIGEPLQVYRRPANLFVAGFIGSPPINWFQGSIVRDVGELRFRALPSAASGSPMWVLKLDLPGNEALTGFVGRPVMLGLRPEHLRCCVDGSVSGPDATVAAVPEMVEHLGPETYIYLSHEGGTLIARTPGDAHIPLNRPTAVHLAMRYARFFDPETGCAIE